MTADSQIPDCKPYIHIFISDCFCKDARSNSQSSTGSTTHNSQEKVMYMPRFHSDYYRDHLSVKDILWQKSNLPFKVQYIITINFYFLI